ncbi:alpha/beta hydrolase family protein [Phycisphaerales bacterium AB-hyl4]|uniref:Alpha/beta hydrolase family protein n=1 Tax=Natronomicrosphaera hydrolytica TaxID=3242702 RepID=A0ABV4U4S0_9BACT
MTSTIPPRRIASKTKLALSPSRVHQRLMAETSPALAYDGGHVRQWQQRLRRKLRQRLGYDKMPREKCPLNVRSLWKKEHELGTIEKIVFTSEPDADVPAYLCLPHGHEPPHPVFICLQGHSTGMHNSIAVAIDDEDKTIEIAGDRDFGLGCLRRGIAALCIEQRSFGERKELEQEMVAKHGCHDAVMHAMMLGRTLAAERVYDVERGIDLLADRDDMDMSRLGVMGNSGGGTITTFAAALLPRVKLAMPSCSFCTFRDSIMSIYHCSDNYIPGLLQDAEMADVLGLFAPKPLVIVNGKTDEIFPITPARRAFADLKAIYRAADAEANVRHVVGPEGHRFYADLAWKAMLPYLR